MLVAIIPARAGSKGVKNKNSKSLGTKTLLLWTLDAANESRYIEKIFITTDIPLSVPEYYGDRVDLLPRPPELARDEVQVDEVVLFAYRQISEQYGPANTVVVLQPTSPFRTAEHIDQALDLYTSLNYPKPVQPQFSSVMGVESSDSFYYQFGTVGMTPLGHDPRTRLGRQDNDFFEDEVLRENGSIYIVHGQRLSNERSFRLDPIEPFRMDKYSSHEIDTPGDLVLAKTMLENKELFV